MRLTVLALASASVGAAPLADAQAIREMERETVAATMTLRIPLGANATRRDAEPRASLQLARTCLGSSLHAWDGCDIRPVEGVSLSSGLDFRSWDVALVGRSGAQVLSWAGASERLSAAEEKQSGSRATWVALGVLGGLATVALVAGALEDDDPTTCTGNTIPNPLTGACEPLRLN
jgi:hypothetical protein